MFRISGEEWKLAFLTVPCPCQTVPSPVFSLTLYIYDLRDGLEWGRFSKADKATDLGGKGKELGEGNLRF